MVIERILNNNVVVVIDSDGKECVVCGLGIAFKKRVGDPVDENAINKKYILLDEIHNKQFQKIVSEIPLEHLEAANEIIDMIKAELGKKLNDSIYITLSDHIHTALERFLEGVIIKSPMRWDIKHFYTEEYRLGLKALEIIHKHFKISLPEDEAAFIALHIVNSEMEDSDIQNVVEMTKIMQEISNIVKYTVTTEFDTESVHYYRFITHLRFFAHRIVTKTTYDSEQEDELLNYLKKKYQMAYRCVEKIDDFITKKYKYAISEEEKLYLTIHIERTIMKD